MSRRSRRAGQLTTLALIGLLIVAFPAGFALAQDLADRGATTQSNHTVVPIINLTSTPTETPTATATQTATPTPTPTATPTPTSGGDNGDGDGDTSGNGQRLVVDKGSGAAGGVTSESDCSNANYTMIQRAVDDAAPGDTVMVCAGTYVESVTVERANLTLLGDGEVVIESLGQTAIQTDAPGVIIRGFTIRAAEAIAVGGRNSLIQDNTIEPIGPDSTGIFLSDGLNEQGQPDTELGAATGSRVVNNTVTAGAQTRYGVFSDADQAVVRANSFSGEDNTTSIRSSGNKSVIRDNTVHHPSPCPRCEKMPGAIVIGAPKSPPWTNNGAGHNWANQNLVVNNSVSRSPGQGMIIGWKNVQSRHENRSTLIDRREVAKGTIVRNTTLSHTAYGMKEKPRGAFVGIANETVYHNNTIISSGSEGRPIQGMIINGHNILIIGNTFQRNLAGLLLSGRNITVKKNTITNSYFNGIGVKASFDGTYRVRLINNKVTGSKFQSGVYLLDNTHVTEFHHNELTGNSNYGVRIATNDFTLSEFHHNLIDNNGVFGIYNQNFDVTDGEWPIVNATNNIWGCGGPSGGLEDPYTGRVANGTGDGVSAGDEQGISNVHFDPFLVRSGCPTSGQTPTPNATPTPTPTPTPSPVDPGNGGGENGGQGTGTGAGTGDGSGDGGGAGTGDGSGDGGGADGDAPSGGGANGADGGDTATPQPTPTATRTATPPPTPTPSDTPTPTPAVEPGFGVLTWFVGVAILVGLLAVRRRSNTARGKP